MRTATVERKTRETEIAVSLDLDGTGESDIDTGIGFLDHMLESFSRHSMIDLKVRATGDLRGRRGRIQPAYEPPSAVSPRREFVGALR